MERREHPGQQDLSVREARYLASEVGRDPDTSSFDLAGSSERDPEVHRTPPGARRRSDQPFERLPTLRPQLVHRPAPAAASDRRPLAALVGVAFLVAFAACTWGMTRWLDRTPEPVAPAVEVAADEAPPNHMGVEVRKGMNHTRTP